MQAENSHDNEVEVCYPGRVNATRVGFRVGLMFDG